MASDGVRYHGKVTIVTGGSRGIGRGIVELFDGPLQDSIEKFSGHFNATKLVSDNGVSNVDDVAELFWMSLVRHGSKVVFCDIREELGREVEKSIKDGNHAGEVMFVKCDMTEEEDIKSLVTTTVEKHGRIDCVINNAGANPYLGTVTDVSCDDMMSLLNVNLVGPFLLCKYAMPYLRKVAGNIINIASIAATLGTGNCVTYIATKGGIWSLTRAIACDEGKHGVRANMFPKSKYAYTYDRNSVSPGIIDTELSRECMASSGLEDPVSVYKSFSILNRRGTAEEVARGCLYLAADGTFCTGFDLKISGGSEIDFAPKLGSVPVQLKYKK